MFKEIGVASKYLGILGELQTVDADGDGIADIKEYAEGAKEVIPEVLLAKKQLEDLQATIGRIQAKMGDKFELLAKDLEYVQAKLEGKKK